MIQEIMVGTDKNARRGEKKKIHKLEVHSDAGRASVPLPADPTAKIAGFSALVVAVAA